MSGVTLSGLGPTRGAFAADPLPRACGEMTLNTPDTTYHPQQETKEMA